MKIEIKTQDMEYLKFYCLSCRIKNRFNNFKEIYRFKRNY